VLPDIRVLTEELAMNDLSELKGWACRGFVAARHQRFHQRPPLRVEAPIFKVAV
jgi:hypothetical protein